MDFVGNKKVVDFMCKILEEGSFSQSYIFSGPENVGKFFLAKSFAAGIIKGEEFFTEENPIEGLLDLIIITPQTEEKGGKKKEKDIPIESIRNAQRELSLFPNKGKKKVLIVNNAHRISISGQNALLKILEEPNSTSVIILVTHEESRLLPTIKSRCQKVSFSLVGSDEMRKMEKLVGNGLFEKYEIMSMGRPGLLMGMLGDKERLDFYESAYDDLDKIYGYDMNRRLSYAEKISKDPSRAIEMLNVWTWIIRKKYFESGDDFADGYYSVISKIEKAVDEIKSTNANSRLILENLLISI